MEDEVLAGVVSHLKIAPLGKKWNKRWAVLYKRSSHGIQRLELHDTKESFEKREKSKKHVTVISLEKCSNILDEVGNETKKNESVIRLNYSSDEKQQVFCWETAGEMEKWFKAISSIVVGKVESMSLDHTYEVEIKMSDITLKLNLEGKYLLSISPDDIDLLDKDSRKIVLKWPLHLLRKYGRDKQEFSLEAGRRCPSGPGMFYFITDQYNAIFQEVENNVKARASVRSRTESASSTSKSSFTNKFPHTNETPPPPSPNVHMSSSVYDDPIDFRKDMSSASEDYTYNEPVNLQPPNASSSGKKQSTKAKDDKKKTKGLSKLKTSNAGPKKNNKKHPTKKAPVPSSMIEDVTYAEALPPNGKSGVVDDLESEYSHINLSGTAGAGGAAVDDEAYDSLSWQAGASALDDSAYATAASYAGRFNDNPPTDDSVYDHVKR